MPVALHSEDEVVEAAATIMPSCVLQSDDELSACEHGGVGDKDTSVSTASLSDDDSSSCVLNEEEADEEKNVPTLEPEHGEANESEQEDTAGIVMTESSLIAGESGPPKNEPNYFFLPRGRCNRRLVVGCIFVSLLFLVAWWRFCASSRPQGAGGQLQWKKPSRQQARKLIRLIESSSRAPGKTFTIKLSGNRVDLLRQSLDHHAICGKVAQIRIHWSGRSKDSSSNNIPEILLNHQHSGKVDVVVAGQGAGAEEVFSTSAVLLLDESVQLSCDELNRAFDQWRRDPARAVGFLPQQGDDHRVLLSDKALFVHKAYLYDGIMKMTHNAVSSSLNRCRHLETSATTASVSSKNPITVLSTPRLITTSQQDDDAEAETRQCIPKLMNAAGLKRSAGQPTIYVGRSTTTFRKKHSS